MLHIVLPLTFVVLHVLVVDVLTETMCLVIHEVTFVCIAIGVCKQALAVGFAIADVTGVGGTVRPHQCAVTVWNENRLLTAPIWSSNNFHLAGVGRAIVTDLQVFLLDKFYARRIFAYTVLSPLLALNFWGFDGRLLRFG